MKHRNRALRAQGQREQQSTEPGCLVLRERTCWQRGWADRDINQDEETGGKYLSEGEAAVAEDPADGVDETAAGAESVEKSSRGSWWSRAAVRLAISLSRENSISVLARRRCQPAIRSLRPSGQEGKDSFCARRGDQFARLVGSRWRTGREMTQMTRKQMKGEG